MRFQILSLPERPVFKPSAPLKTPADFEAEDGATIRTVIKRSLGVEE